jgi:quinohemoprotein ethanol dehydrogenase
VYQPKSGHLRKKFGSLRRGTPAPAPRCAGLILCGIALAGTTAFDPSVSTARSPGDLDAARLQAADSEPQNWFVAGRDKDGTYYSPLTSINAQNVKELGFAWQYDLGDPRRGQQATPIVIDGVMFTSGTWGYVYAVDAATGRELWRYDPKPNAFTGRHPCCDLVNRGVAVWKGKVYVASTDGRLHALNAQNGEKIWEADTITDHTLPYSSTGIPQIAGRAVIIGNAGADMGHGAVRGYVSAYDLDTGVLKWRFYTVPGVVGHAFENRELAAAEKTWDPHRPAYLGGGTAWDGFAYDPNLDIVYFGTGNAAPYDRGRDRPELDCLYTAAIVALHADSGRLAWYYQTTPGDSWDYDSTQKLVLADLKVDGTLQPVIMQASKNGFFYVLNRATGKLLSAKNFTFVNWASRVDMSTGRPVLTKNADWHASPKNVYPSAAGAHTWNPMSYDKQTQLVYIPVLDVPVVWVDMPRNGGSVKYVDGTFTVNGITPDDTYDAADLRHLFGPLPNLSAIRATRRVQAVRELLRAWDPVRQKIVWEHETSSGIRGYDGGVMSTAGNLVFQGRGSGELWVYEAATGEVLKVIRTGSHIMAAPMTYSVDGTQYVAIQVGYGGAAFTIGPFPPSSAALKYENTNRIIALKLGGGRVPTPSPRIDEPFAEPPMQTASRSQIDAGEIKFIQECSRCHVMGPSITPDLRKLNDGQRAAFKDIVLEGVLAPAGMERFDDLLSEEDVDDIYAYLIEQSWTAYRTQRHEAAQHEHSLQ